MKNAVLLAQVLANAFIDLHALRDELPEDQSYEIEVRTRDGLLGQANPSAVFEKRQSCPEYVHHLDKREDPGGEEPECAWSAHLYKGWVKSRSGLSRSIVMTMQPDQLLERKTRTARSC